jgi:thiol-disulfide isomerase/thioredoxin
VKVETPKPESKTYKIETVDEQGLSNLLAQSSERTRVISFWATWCTPCIVEISMLDAVARIHTDVEFILVNVDHPAVLQRRVIPFIKERQLSTATLYHLVSDDPSTSLAKVVPNWPESIPVTLIKDKTGLTIERFDKNIHRNELEAALKRASHY